MYILKRVHGVHVVQQLNRVRKQYNRNDCGFTRADRGIWLLRCCLANLCPPLSTFGIGTAKVTEHPEFKIFGRSIMMESGA